jgi:hypothetical protein
MGLFNMENDHKEDWAGLGGPGAFKFWQVTEWGRFFREI